MLLSTPVSFLKVKVESGSRSAKKMIVFKDNIDRPLSAILSLNTIAHTVGAAGAGAQATKVFGEAYFGLVSAILTYPLVKLSSLITGLFSESKKENTTSREEISALANIGRDGRCVRLNTQ